MASAWDENGQNNFLSSTINTYLNTELKTSLNNLEIKKTSFCLKYNNQTCQKSVDMKFGLLTIKDYLNASNNLNCKTGLEAACKEGNYLSNFSIENGPEYTINTYNNNIYIIKDGLLSTTNPKEKLNIRPVITLNSNEKIIGGSGTEDNPYIINVV